MKASYRHCRVQRLFLLFVSLVIVIVVVVVDVQGLAGPSDPTSARQHRLRRQRQRPPAWSDFCFAPNGVCTSPARFVVVDTHDDDNDNKQRQRQSFTLRNVPGTGDCVFLAVALASFASVGLGANHVLLQAITKELRALTAAVLEQPNGSLLLEGQRFVTTTALLQSAVSTTSTTTTTSGCVAHHSTEEYLRLLRLEGREGGLYGGGPELTVLCNLLRRPISIYEIASFEVEEEEEEEEAHVVTDATNTTSKTDTTTMPYLSFNDTASDYYCYYCPIVCKGTFGGPLLADPLANVPHSAVTSLSHNLLPGAYSWHLHILMVETAPNVKHACVLLPQPQQSQQRQQQRQQQQEPDTK